MRFINVLNRAQFNRLNRKIKEPLYKQVNSRFRKWRHFQ